MQSMQYMHKKCKCLVLGFYHRQNIGDEAYKLVIKKAFGAWVHTFDFVCIDDLKGNPSLVKLSDYDVIICGGGDIINKYFMEETVDMLEAYKTTRGFGRVYAVSVGIPYPEDAQYLHVFDHVFVRSREDFNIAAKEIGTANVTLINDLVFGLQKSLMNFNVEKYNNDVIHVGLCLANPCFYKNDGDMEGHLVDTLVQFNSITISNVQFHLIPFNLNQLNEKESDYVVNTNICALMKSNNINVINHTELTNPLDILNFMKNEIDVCVCMRYHSAIFCLLCGIPFVGLYASSKMNKLLIDYNIKGEECKVDENGKPIGYDKAHFLRILCNLSTQKRNSKVVNSFLSDVETCCNYIFKQEMRHWMLAREHKTSKTYHELLQECIKIYLQDDGEYIDKARFICYLLSGCISHPCMWGLAENMQHLQSFDIAEAIKYIWEFEKEHNDLGHEKYFPYISNNVYRGVKVNVDGNIYNDFTRCHRAGWGYVVGGIIGAFGGGSDLHENMYIDTYVDRSFHWGFNSLKTLGILPYKKPWMGVIHHTFLEGYSEYNCVNLFKNPYFLESLQTCKGLIVLSKCLGVQVRRALKAVGNDKKRIPVFVIYHPTEFVHTNMMFTMEKLTNVSIRNKGMGVVQIGAWLRNPYAIYQLECKDGWVKKKVLRGHEMEMYFAPHSLYDDLWKLLSQEKHIPDGLSQCSGGCRVCEEGQFENKFCMGLWNMLSCQRKSVQLIDKLENDDYDVLLSENVVFLNLLDCSACNTVIECIVRNTPIIVNRLPALEEILGQHYPGFYGTLDEASKICKNIDKIKNIHVYLQKMDKTIFQLEYFLKRFYDVVTNQTELQRVHSPIQIDHEKKYNYFDKFIKPSKKYLH